MQSFRKNWKLVIHFKDFHERDLVATEERCDKNKTSSRPEYLCFSTKEISKKISQHNESIKVSTWRAMQKDAEQSDEGVKTHTTLAGETFFVD